MNELLVGAESQPFETLLDKIFDRLDIVVGFTLDGLDCFGVLDSEIAINRPQGVEDARIDSFKGRQGQFAQCDEVLDLNLDAVADQGTLGKIRGQGVDRTAVAAVHRGNGRQGRKGYHRSSVSLVRIEY